MNPGTGTGAGVVVGGLVADWRGCVVDPPVRVVVGFPVPELSGPVSLVVLPRGRVVDVKRDPAESLSASPPPDTATITTTRQTNATTPTADAAITSRRFDARARAAAIGPDGSTVASSTGASRPLLLSITTPSLRAGQANTLRTRYGEVALRASANRRRR